MNKTFMKSFEIIKEMYEYFVKKYRDLEPKLMVCEKENFDNIENHLKALEIIKEKKVEVNTVIYYLKMEVSDDQVCHWYNTYAIDVDEEPERVLNEEDLACLKEVLL